MCFSGGRARPNQHPRSDSFGLKRKLNVFTHAMKQIASICPRTCVPLCFLLILSQELPSSLSTLVAVLARPSLSRGVTTRQEVLVEARAGAAGAPATSPGRRGFEHARTSREAEWEMSRGWTRRGEAEGGRHEGGSTRLGHDQCGGRV